VSQVMEVNSKSKYLVDPEIDHRTTLHPWSSALVGVEVFAIWSVIRKAIEACSWACTCMSLSSAFFPLAS
jgi:hypothetical protein